MKIDAALVQNDIAGSGASAKALEEQGFDGVMSFEGANDPFIPLALAAEATEKVDLITAVAIAFARTPMTVAYQANDIHALSGGRFVLGLGSQIRPHVEKRFSMPWSKPNARMREFVQALRAIFKCWNEGERLQFRGEFYTHTLMSPFLSPQPNPHGAPPIFLAGFGPSMIRVVGEVADGWILHPMHSPAYVDAVAEPALEEGLGAAGRARSEVEIAAQTIVVVGDTDEQLEKAKVGARAQIAFYGSTPAYKVFLDHHGWGGLQPELNAMTKTGGWLEMAAKITDDMLDTIAVCGKPAEVGAKLRERNRFAARTSVILYNEAGPDAVSDIVRGVHGG